MESRRDRWMQGETASFLRHGNGQHLTTGPRVEFSFLKAATSLRLPYASEV